MTIQAFMFAIVEAIRPGDIVMLRMGGAYEVTDIQDSYVISHELKFKIDDVKEIYRLHSTKQIYERIYPIVEDK